MHGWKTPTQCSFLQTWVDLSDQSLSNWTTKDFGSAAGAVSTKCHGSINQITKGSSSGVTLSLALRSKGEAGQPVTWLFRRLLFISGPPPPPPPRTLRADPKHCNLQCFCAFGMEKVLLATCWKLRKVNTSVFARHWPKNTVNTVVFVTRGKQHRKYRGFGLPRRKTHQYLRCFLLRELQTNVKTPPIWRFSATTGLRRKLHG